ncbi:MAG: DoxX family protein [Hyphomicrobiales bacterium]|nr:DoxX family protein [Alphaproteobacteria bacterium]
MASDIDRNRLLIPGLATFYSSVEPYTYPFMRFVVGALLIPHGIEKLERGVSVFAANNPAKLGFYPPTVWGWVVVAIEVIGGTCIALGLFTRFFAAAAAIELAIVAFGVHSATWSWTTRGMEYPLMWGCMMLIVALRGGGEYSIDRKYLGREL